MDAETYSCDASTPYFEAYTAISGELRCMVCGGQRIASSDAPFALSVKSDICRYLHEGLAPEDILLRIGTDYGRDLQVETAFSPPMLPLLGAMCLVFLLALWRLKSMIAGK